eukprot:Hpha_TRINITY_DN13372_c0_g1::TRINITY_DN13372_c0_g1_i1::g.95706::m.95706
MLQLPAAEPRPNQRPLQLPDGSYDLLVAALRIQCAWRRRVANRVVENQRRRVWLLNRNALRIQRQIRAFIARVCRNKLRDHREKLRAARDAAFERQSFAAFEEGLLWRRALCEEKASYVQQWWRSMVKGGRLRQALLGAGTSSQRNSLVSHPFHIHPMSHMSSTPPSRPADPDMAGSISLMARTGPVGMASPSHTEALSAAVPHNLLDRPPPSGTLRPPIRAPPSSGVPNVNVRKVERERRELRMLETELFVQNTRSGDQQFALSKERHRIENNSAMRIQCMYRSRAARAVVHARSLERQDRMQSMLEGVSKYLLT